MEKAAAQNSLIRPAVIHRVITGQASRRLQTGAQLRGVSLLKVKMETKENRDIQLHMFKGTRSLILPANSPKGVEMKHFSLRIY
jgi:hypothetical protein